MENMVPSFSSEMFQMITMTLTHEHTNCFQCIPQTPADICDEDISESIITQYYSE